MTSNAVGANARFPPLTRRPCASSPDNMTAFFTLHFRRRYQHLSTKRQVKLDKQLGFLPANPIASSQEVSRGE